MAEPKKKLPIGIESFEEIITCGYYYADKTKLIADLINGGSKVTLFTRPRRFGKTLNISMLEAFFSPLVDKGIFGGLYIAGEKNLCDEYMGNYPVISFSLKNLEGGSYENAYRQLIRLVNRAARKVYQQVKDSDRLLREEMEELVILMNRNIDEPELSGSLCTLSEILGSYYGQKTIILIDEYDVPLAKAYEDGYYDRMARLIRNLFHQALKTNDSMKLAVLTGCMRISKESIFTGLNNLDVRSVSDEEFDEYFGFTDCEVRLLLDYYGLSGYYEAVRDWYDGYRFGRTSIYCPWDVICYCKKLRTDSDHSPENYWLNSSGNYAVRRFVELSDNSGLKVEIEDLINGRAVEKTVRQDLTYQDMYTSVDNIWSVLYTTGYLTREESNAGRLRLVIPNREICNIFSEQIIYLFREDVCRDGEALAAFCSALRDGDTNILEEKLNAYLRRTISVRDTAVRRSLKENFYHGILLGILAVKSGWAVTSNQESGNGYSDIQVRDVQSNLGIVIEVKYADDGDMEQTCLKGLEQIEEKHYAQGLEEEGYKTILKYGISFYLKTCRVMLDKQK